MIPRYHVLFVLALVTISSNAEPEYPFEANKLIGRAVRDVLLTTEHALVTKAHSFHIPFPRISQSRELRRCWNGMRNTSARWR